MTKEYYELNKDKMRVHARRYYDAHRQEILSKSQAKRDAHRQAEGREKGVHRKYLPREFPQDQINVNN